MQRTKHSVRIHHDNADAACVARIGEAATAAAGRSLGVRAQLPRGNRPGAKNAHDQCAKERCFGLLVHGGFPSCSITRRGACRFGECEITHAYVGSGLREDARAAQNVGATFVRGAEAAAGVGLKIQRQLASGNRSRAENSGDHRRKNGVSHCLTHGLSFLSTS